jgi:hypothetical protein
MARRRFIVSFLEISEGNQRMSNVPRGQGYTSGFAALEVAGAGEGNRTLVCSLGSWQVRNCIKYLAAKPTLSAPWDVKGLAQDNKTVLPSCAACRGSKKRQCSLLGRAPRSGRGVGGEHPEQHLAGYAGLMQADAYAGFTKLYEPNRKPGVIIEVACWAHARRKFFDLARLSRAPIAVEAVKHIDALFAIERDINGAIPQERVRVRQARSRPLIIEPHTWLREQRAKLSKNSDTPKRSITSSLSHAAWSSAVGSNWA